MRRAENNTWNEIIPNPIVSKIQPYYRLEPKTGGLLLIPEDDVEKCVFIKAYLEGKFHSWTNAVTRAGYVPQPGPGASIFYSSWKFGVEREHQIKDYLFVQYMLARTNLDAYVEEIKELEKDT